MGSEEHTVRNSPETPGGLPIGRGVSGALSLVRLIENLLVSLHRGDNLSALPPTQRRPQRILLRTELQDRLREARSDYRAA